MLVISVNAVSAFTLDVEMLLFFRPFFGIFLHYVSHRNHSMIKIFST